MHMARGALCRHGMEIAARQSEARDRRVLRVCGKRLSFRQGITHQKEGRCMNSFTAIAAPSSTEAVRGSQLVRWLRGTGRANDEGGLTVRASLQWAFACVLAGALVIGAFSLWQMGRINASTQALYEQEYAAGQAAEQLRGLVLRASRAQRRWYWSMGASKARPIAGMSDCSAVLPAAATSIAA